jgi:copper transport protein
VAVLALVTAEALGGHAASAGSGAPATSLAVAATAAHVLAACCWLGAVPAVLLTGWAPLPAGVTRAEVLGACRGALTRLVLAAGVTVVVSGLVVAGRQVGYPGGLTSSGYGRALLVKGALLVVLTGLGALTGARLAGRGRRPARSTGRRLLVAEAGVGLLVLLAAAVLLETAPPRGAPTRPAPAATATATAADLLVAVTASPGTPGTSGLTVRVASSRRPPPARVEGVSIRPAPAAGTAVGAGSDAGSDAVPLREIGDGRWFGVVPLGDASGPVRAVVRIRRGGVRVDLPVSWVPGRPPPVAGRRLSGFTDPLAAALLLAVLAGVAGHVLRRPRPPGEPGAMTERTPHQVLEGSR